MTDPETAPILPEGCSVCGKSTDLLRCTACKVLRYCGRDHQMKDRQEHKSICREIRLAREKVEQAKQSLINDPEFQDNDPFVNHVGDFWVIPKTRPYMMGLSQLIQAIQGIDHHDAVQAELEICREMLRLCPGDNMGVRSSVPGVMLRLNMDQECYDFIKWWETKANDRDFDWDDHSRYYDIKDADALEPVDFTDDKTLGQLSHLICLMILKIKLLMDLTQLQDMDHSFNRLVDEKFGGPQHAPPELFKEFCLEYQSPRIRSPVIRARGDLMRHEGLPATVEAVKQQIDALHNIIDKRNKHFWPGIKDGEKTVSIPPSNIFAMGSVEEMRLAFNSTWTVLTEVPGAFEFVAFLLREKQNGSIP